MNIDPVLLARVQFGATASFHILFPCLIIGLGSYLAVLEVLWLRTRRSVYREQFEFWTGPFAAVFIVGVITGVVLSYQLDTVFGGFYEKTVDVLVPIRRLEFLNAMLLEAGCFGIMVWGWRRVGERLHLVATLVVTLGIYVSVACILSRNSWMQTPAGYALIDGELHLTDLWAAVFNPSFPYRLAHMIGAAWVSSAFFVMGVCAWLLLRQPTHSFAAHGLRSALLACAVLVPVQLLSGDLHGLNTRDHQPLKLAAMEGLWQTTAGAPLVPFALPDQEQERNRYAVEIPRLASLIITHDLDGEVLGLNAAPKAERPNVPIVFFSFRIMVSMGLLMMVVTVAGVVLLRRRKLYDTRWYLGICCWMAPSGLLATIAGWCVTEAGRQPWVVYGLIRTSEVAHGARGAEGLGAAALIGITYALLLGGLLHCLRRTLKTNVDRVRTDVVVC